MAEARGDGQGDLSGYRGFRLQQENAKNSIVDALRQRDGKSSSSHANEAWGILQDEPMFQVDKYQGMGKKDAEALRKDWVQQYVGGMHQDYLDKLKGNVPPPVVNAPVMPPPNQGSNAPPSASMPNGGVPSGTTPADPTSYWSSKAPQLQVEVTDPADPIQYDYSHLQRQPLQSAAEKFKGSTEASRALRSGVGSRYSGGGQNG